MIFKATKIGIPHLVRKERPGFLQPAEQGYLTRPLLRLGLEGQAMGDAMERPLCIAPTNCLHFATKVPTLRDRSAYTYRAKCLGTAKAAHAVGRRCIDFCQAKPPRRTDKCPVPTVHLATNDTPNSRFLGL